MHEDISTNTILKNGRYQVEKELGRGGMGAVYLAQDVQQHRRVAIRVTRLADPSARAQFARGAADLQRMHHYGLPRVWDYFSDAQRDFLVIEYIPGESLEKRVHEQGPQPEWLVLRWADELLDALEYLHGQNPPVIHRDIKPSNLRLRQDETLVLVDLGMAKDNLPDVRTHSEAVAVSPGYASPEQYSPDAVTDAQSDLYSLGATLYHLLTGTVPPSAPDRAAGMHILIPITHLTPQVSVATDMLVRRALNLARGERWSSATQMRHAVARATRQFAPSTTETLPEPHVFGETASGTQVLPTSRPSRRKPAWLAVGLLAVLSLGLGAFVLFWNAGGISGIGIAAPIQPTPVPVVTTIPTDPASPDGTITPAIVSSPTSSQTPTDTPTPETGVSVNLLDPLDGDSGFGPRTFRWRIERGALMDDQRFQLVFWRPGQDPLAGFTPEDPTDGTQVQVDFDGVDQRLGPGFGPGQYFWGILLVRPVPYAKIRLLAGPRVFSIVTVDQQTRTVTTTRTPTPPPPTKTPIPVPTRTPTPTMTATFLPPTATPEPPDTPEPAPTDTPRPTNTPQPTNTPKPPTNTPEPTQPPPTPVPTQPDTPVPTRPPKPTNTPEP